MSVLLLVGVTQLFMSSKCLVGILVVLNKVLNTSSSLSFFEALWLAAPILLWFSVLQRHYRVLITLSHVPLYSPCPGKFALHCISTISGFFE